MDTQTIKLYKRLSRKFKVLGGITAILGLSMIVFGLTIHEILFSLLGAGMAVLGVYFFVDNLGVFNDKDVESWANRQQ